MRSSFPAVLLATCALAGWPSEHVRAAGETSPRAFRAPVEAAAGTNVGFLVVTPFGVRVLDATGRAIGALRTSGDDGPRRLTAAPMSQPLWPGLTADGDFSGAAYNPDDIDDTDDPRLADDTAARPWDIDETQARAGRGRLLTAASPVRTLLAATGASGWLVRDGGLWRIDLRTGVAVHVYGANGSRIRALAAGSTAGGEVVVALVDGDRVVRGQDDRFATIGGPVAHVRGLAIGSAGTVFALEGDGRLRAYARAPTGPGDRVTVFGAGVDDVVTCAPGLLVLKDDVLFVVTDQGADVPQGIATPVARLLGPAPPGTERLACDPSGGGWAAFGTTVSVSADDGRTWVPRPSSPIRPIHALVPTRAALWIAVPLGLWPLPAIDVAESPAAATMAEANLRAAPTTSTGRPETWPRTSDFWRRWSTLLPEVDVDFEIGRVGAVRDLRGMLAASFRLDGPWAGGVPVRTRRRHQPDALPSAPTALQLDALAVGAGDPVARDERRALARILEESP